MEQIEFNYPAKRVVRKRAHVGVVGSGDLEVLLEPAEVGRTCRHGQLLSNVSALPDARSR
jgi:hypothetical protein